MIRFFIELGSMAFLKRKMGLNLLTSELIKKENLEVHYMIKVVIPYLVIGNEKIETPIGLSEILESTWVRKGEDDFHDEIANKYKRTTFKIPNGQWVTKFELK